MSYPRSSRRVRRALGRVDWGVVVAARHFDSIEIGVHVKVLRQPSKLKLQGWLISPSLGAFSFVGHGAPPARPSWLPALDPTHVIPSE